MKKFLLITGAVVLGLFLIFLATCFMIGFGQGVATGVSPSLPDVPVKVTSRQAFVGQGDVAQIHNTSDRELPFQVKISSATFKKEATYNLIIPPDQTREIGAVAGWAAAPGDVLEISSAGYGTKKFTLR